MYQLSSEPKSIFKVFANGTRLYKSLFVKLLPFSIILILFLFLFGWILPSCPNESAQIAALAHHHPVKFSPLYFLIGLLFLLLFPVISAFIYDQGYALMHGEKKKYRHSFKVAFRYYFIYIISGFFFIIAIYLSAFAFIIPGFFLTFLLLFYKPAILFDQKGIFSSWKYSAQLVWGNWWRTLGTVLLSSIVIGITVFVLFIVVATLLVTLIQPHPVAEAVTGLYFWILKVFFLGWGYSIILEQYHDLKLRLKLKKS